MWKSGFLLFSNSVSKRLVWCVWRFCSLFSLSLFLRWIQRPFRLRVGVSLRRVGVSLYLVHINSHFRFSFLSICLILCKQNIALIPFSQKGFPDFSDAHFNVYCFGMKKNETIMADKQIQKFYWLLYIKYWKCLIQLTCYWPTISFPKWLITCKTHKTNF